MNTRINLFSLLAVLATTLRCAALNVGDVMVMGYSTTAEELKAINPKGIILSGGPSSVYAEHAPLCDSEIWNLGIPVLGVCYGMQLIVQQLGGSVVAAGRAAVPTIRLPGAPMPFTTS